LILGLPSVGNSTRRNENGTQKSEKRKKNKVMKRGGFDFDIDINQWQPMGKAGRVMITTQQQQH